MTPPPAGHDRRSHDRLTIDVSLLPDVAFGHRGLTWWATAAFMTIEGTTLAICIAAYFYLRFNSDTWPPRPIAPPDLLFPTLNVLVLLAKLWPMGRAEHAAKRFDVGGVRRWMAIGMLFATVTVVLRWLEIRSLNVRWDTNAYGSGVWMIVVAHTTLLVTDWFESGAITVLFFGDRVLPKHFSDVEDTAIYERFLSLSWLVLYLVLVLAPRVL